MSVARSGVEAQGRADGEAWVQHWLAAMRWQRRVEALLARFGLSLAQWLVLDALATIRGETMDAVSQVQVCRRLGLGKGSVSRVMTRLDQRGLVDIAPAWPTKEYRIYLTREGTELLEQGWRLVELVSRSAR